MNPNIQDCDKALPILYAAQQCQYDFMVILRKHKSEVNFCTTNNETPLIEVIKHNKNFSVEQIEHLLALGMDSNFPDMDKRNVLHHLVFQSSSLDSTPELFRMLLQHGCKINALDKYDRSPIFYCFCEMEEHGAG
jgi:ankyrin repeat protein